MLWMLYSWLPNFIFEHYHLSLEKSGVMATLYLQSSTIAGVILGGFLGDRLGKRFRVSRFYIVALGMLASCPFAYAMLAVESLPCSRRRRRLRRLRGNAHRQQLGLRLRRCG